MTSFVINGTAMLVNIATTAIIRWSFNPMYLLALRNVESNKYTTFRIMLLSAIYLGHLEQPHSNAYLHSIYIKC